MEQLKIGQVTASEEIVQEISEMEDFQVFCMSCVRRHRSGDWGDVPRDIWVDNNLSFRKGGRIISEYAIPEIFRVKNEEEKSFQTNLLRRRSSQRLLTQESPRRPPRMPSP